MVQRVKRQIDNNSGVVDEWLECLFFACHFYTSHSLTSESEKLIDLLLSISDSALTTRVRILNEQSRIFFLNGETEKAWGVLNESKLYMPQFVETQLLEAGALVSDASEILEEVDKIRSNKDTTLDELLTKEHNCTKKLIAAEQIVTNVLQRDQRITSAWQLWGQVLEMLGRTDKAAEVLLTCLECEQRSSFESVSTCRVIVLCVF